VHTNNPWDEAESPSLRSFLARTAMPEIVVDLSLQDYLAATGHAFAKQTLRVLVVTTDIYHLRMAEGLPADVVVINRCPSHLPMDVAEYAAYFPKAWVVFWPWEPEQGHAIARATPLAASSRTVQQQSREILKKGGMHRVSAGSLITSGTAS